MDGCENMIERIPKALITRIMHNAGAKLVSADAKETMSDFMIDYAIALTVKAMELAEHGGRVTVTKRDVELAGSML